MTILDEIIEHTRRSVDRRKRAVSTAELRSKPAFHAPTLPLAGPLRSDNLAVIGEIKKASPSNGTIRAEFDVRDIAREYKHHGAAAISVLTEPDYFSGSLDDLATARRTVDLPLLRKDFIVDPYQLVEARAFGADAVLLIASALAPGELYDLHARAEELGLACLVEAYTEEDIERVDLSQVEILGINNRDLRTFTVDIAHSLELFKHIPSHVVKVSESGLAAPHDLARVRREGIDAVLIGETFMRAYSPGRKLAELLAGTQAVLDSEQEVLRRVG